MESVWRVTFHTEGSGSIDDIVSNLQDEDKLLAAIEKGEWTHVYAYDKLTLNELLNAVKWEVPGEYDGKHLDRVKGPDLITDKAGLRALEALAKKLDSYERVWTGWGFVKRPKRW